MPTGATWRLVPECVCDLSRGDTPQLWYTKSPYPKTHLVVVAVAAEAAVAVAAAAVAAATISVVATATLVAATV